MTASVDSTPIDAAALLASVAHPGLGGTALFLGTVRQGPEDGMVEAIEYSAYDAMAKQELDRIVEEAATRWPKGRFAARHRIGLIVAGEASVGVAAAMPHRAEAFEACRWIIEEIKRRLPVWKKERFADGTSSWRETGANAAQVSSDARRHTPKER